MESAYNISARQVMNTDPLTASIDESLAQVAHRMEENDLRAIPVLDGEDFVGAIGYRDMVRFIQFNPAQAKLDNVMHQPPEFETGDSLVELCGLRVNSGRKMMVALADGKLEGVIGDRELLEAFQNIEDFKDASTRRLAAYEVITVSEDDILEKARHAMLDNNISRLPVVDDGGDLSGVIDSTDVLRMLIPRDSPDAGGTAGERHGREEINIAGGNEKDRMSDITVDQLMQRNPCTSQEHMRGDKALAKMLDENTDEIIFTDGSYPEFIVTLKDFVDFLAEMEQRNTVLVNLVGIELPEEKAAVHDKIKNQLQGSLGRKLERPEELKVHISKAEKDGRKHRYEFDIQLVSEYGITNIDVESWDLLEGVDEGLDELNKVVRKKKEKRDERRKQ